MLAELVPSAKIAAVDISPGPAPVLAEFIQRRELDQRVGVHFGLAQDDRDGLSSLLAERFGSAHLDLVIDDASHGLAESRASFEIAFPRVREGGRYLLEDWSSAHASIAVRPEQPPLTLMVFELIMACAHNPEVVAAVDINRGWAVVERGPAELDPASFRLGELYGDRAGSLLRSAGAAPAGRRRRQRARLPWA